MLRNVFPALLIAILISIGIARYEIDQNPYHPWMQMSTPNNHFIHKISIDSDSDYPSWRKGRTNLIIATNFGELYTCELTNGCGPWEAIPNINSENFEFKTQEPNPIHAQLFKQIDDPIVTTVSYYPDGGGYQASHIALLENGILLQYSGGQLPAQLLSPYLKPIAYFIALGPLSIICAFILHKIQVLLRDPTTS